MFTTFPSHQSCLHVADSTPIICSPPISPTHDIEISIPSNAAPQLEHCPHELHRILYEFSQVFSTNKYNVPKLNIPPVKINTTTDKIIALRPYRVPLHDQQEIQTQIEQMLQYGIIAPSVSPYASPITLVTKRDQTKRFCIDYRKLNEIIAPDVHPLPLIETILDKLSKAKYYSSVDIASAYWQVEIEPNSRNLLAFVTLDSQYEFCRLPYGFKNSPQIYHRAINQVMQKYKLNFVTHYFDDFIIFSDTLEDHLQHLQQFLTVCQHENIKLNYNKCSFFKTKIDFLGYTVTAGTYAPQTRNLDTINAIKPPNNQKTLQSFLGAVNVYNKVIADYARLRAPLNKLLKKDVKWNWNTDCQQAFTTLKESLTSKPVLHLYQVGLPCRLYCDASTQGIAGILKQVHPDGQIHPVQYFSRALRAHERNYTVSELECLAIVESVDKFRIYLTGIKFTIYTDHQALQWLKTIKNPSGRLFRWSLRLSTYNYEIHYIKGSQQYEADLLSRNPFVGFISTDIIKQHQPTASPFNIDTNGLHTITRKGVTKIIIPETLQHTLMNKVHQEYNHPGISQMTRIITTQYYWKGISKSIEKFVRSCHTCQIIKKPKGKPYGALGQIPPPQQPFDLISIDTIAGFSKYGHSKTYLHVIVDHLTRYAWTFPSKSTSTLTYIQTLKTVLQQGSPKRLLSDRAPAFTSEKFRKFLIMHGIQPLLTTSNNPQANGLIERLNATITGKLRLAYLENPKASWTQLVKRVTQTYNNTPHSVTSFPPTYLMFNVIPPDLRTHLNPYPEIKIAREIANSRTQNKHKKDKETFDKQHRTPHFEENDLVLVKNYRHPDTGKLAPYFTGPYKIIQIISPNVVRIDRPNQPLNRDSDTIHVNKLKYYTEDVLYITPPQPRFVQHPQRLPQDGPTHRPCKTVRNLLDLHLSFWLAFYLFKELSTIVSLRFVCVDIPSFPLCLDHDCLYPVRTVKDPTRCREPKEFKGLLFSLCLFHSAIMERRKFGPLGFNIAYEFMDGDLQICINQLRMFLSEYFIIPYKVLSFTAGEINYGGRVTDDWDRRCIMNILDDFYRPEVLQENFQYTRTYRQLPPDTLHVGYIEYLQELPINDPPEIFGLHENANITYAQNESYKILNCITQLQPKTATSAEQSREEVIAHTAQTILAQIPKPFNIKLISERYPLLYEQSMNTVLSQEAVRFNKLLNVINGTLKDLLKALKGIVVMSQALENMAGSLFLNAVPKLWAAKVRF
ncbi:hypothetical protein LAZ67_3005993 [Cordylochernes scorpioides]|uniref:RNA-directed DNA polymerase n=1 Tax=Cordylochernes scorpioides TaxID=51811 RepID=A0ABY6KAT6_9ARAC|nr:hypothetical protein LAZ67_3005993 [Cordylochernes scorpioides]